MVLDTQVLEARATLQLSVSRECQRSTPADLSVDTYRTRDHADDPPTPHISLHSPPDAHHRSSLACTSVGQIPWLSDGRSYTLELIYNSQRRSLQAHLASSHTAEAEEIPLWEVKIPFSTTTDPWYLAMTGACGGLWQRQEVLEWIVEEIDIETSEGDDVVVV